MTNVASHDSHTREVRALLHVNFLKCMDYCLRVPGRLPGLQLLNHGRHLSVLDVTANEALYN